MATALRGRPDPVRLDIPLPDLGGQGVLRRLRAGGCSGTCIARSANAMPEDVARPRAAGFDDHRTRPIDFDRALATIDHLAAHAAATGSG